MPDNLKSGIERLSGYSMDDVRVHFNSPKPARFQAHAYARGSDIHVAASQEKHLPHEAWHVVQQKQGRVKPTGTVGGVSMNGDVALENEATVMGRKALQRVGVDAMQPVTTGRVGEALIQLRDLKVGRKKLSNLPKALKNRDFVALLAQYGEQYGADRVQFMASQLFSASGEDFESLDQFRLELEYDLQTKSFGEEALTLQEQYMTEYGWKRAAKADRPAKKGPPQTLKLYRTMSIADWKRLNAGDYKVLEGGHIGDFKQALKYFMGSSTDHKGMVEFTLKPGSERALFSCNLALPATKERSTKVKTIAKAIGGSSFPVCNTDQGTSSSAIGIKSESEGEAGFSIGIGGGNTPSKFMALVQTIALKSVGGDFSKDPTVRDDQTRIESDARLLLTVNNCLINAIALAALGREATLAELIAIRAGMNNYGEMLLASPEVVNRIRAALGITVPITVNYQGAVPAEDFDGVGDAIHVYHVNGNHFTHEFPE